MESQEKAFHALQKKSASYAITTNLRINLKGRRPLLENVSAMGIKSRPIEPHWNYLLSLERDVERLSRYIDFHEKNLSCFSIEIARILLAAGAEADVICKQLCVKLDANSTAGSINAYRAEIKAAYSNIHQFEVLIPRYGLLLKPWNEWKRKDGVPLWWTAYNKTKHHRNSDYHLANLHNALNAVCGLFIIILYLYKERAQLGELLPALTLIRVGGANFGGTTPVCQPDPRQPLFEIT